MPYYEVTGPTKGGITQRSGAFKGRKATTHIINADTAKQAKSRWRAAHPKSAHEQLVVSVWSTDDSEREAVSANRRARK